jgi:hypothetical protein
MGGEVQSHMEDSITAFGRFLRQVGFEIGTGEIMNAIHAVETVGVLRKDDFQSALRSTLITTNKKIELFNEVFELYWRNPDRIENVADILRKLYESRLAQAELEQMTQPKTLKEMQSLREVEGSNDEATLDQVDYHLLMYSRDEVLRQKDFSTYTDDEIKEAKTILDRFIWDFGNRLNRRMKSGKKAHRLNFKKTFRKNMFPDQDFVRLMWSEKKTKPRPIVTLCDVSASMENYTKILLHFMHTFSGLNRRVESFIFGTQLTRITKYFKDRDVDSAIKELSQNIKDWSGGTRIGEAIESFNFHWARRVLNQGAVVIIISDGWDTGATSLLSSEMERLNKSCHRLIWLNPNLGFEGYQPLTQGIQAILPNVDEFLPVHNLKSLIDLGKVLSDLDQRGRQKYSYKTMAVS